MERDSFVFYKSFMAGVETLSTPEEKLKAYQYILMYGFYGEEPDEINGPAYGMFLMAKANIDANNKKYVDGCKGGKFGHLGGAPKGNSNAVKDWDNISKQPHRGSKDNPSGVMKTTPNDNDNDNDNVNDNVNENGNENENEKPYKLTAKAVRGGVGKKSDILSLIHIEGETEEEKQELDEARKAYKEMRKKIKKPLTEYAEKLRAKDLVKLGVTARERIEILNQSTASGWQDLYELKDKPRPKLKGNMYH